MEEQTQAEPVGGSMIDQAISRYRIVDKLGEGGMASSTRPRTPGSADWWNTSKGSMSVLPTR
jgi:hypothetical protein